MYFIFYLFSLKNFSYPLSLFFTWNLKILICIQSVCFNRKTSICSTDTFYTGFDICLILRLYIFVAVSKNLLIMNQHGCGWCKRQQIEFISSYWLQYERNVNITIKKNRINGRKPKKQHSVFDSRHKLNGRR